MASRDTFTSASPPPVGGPDFVDQVAGHMGTMYQYLPLEITLTSGAAPNVLTGTIDPPLSGSGLAQGMSFWLEPSVDNTGAVTIAIGAEAAVDLVDDQGAGLAAGALKSTGRYLLNFDGTDMRVVNHVSSLGATTGVQIDTFTADGTLTKPVGFPDDGLVIVELVGAGMGGGRGSSGASANGGYGGAFVREFLTGVDFSSSEAVSVGAGGAGRTSGTGDGSDGGDTSVGAIVSCRGGSRTESLYPIGTEIGGGLVVKHTYRAGAVGGNSISLTDGGYSIKSGDGGDGGINNTIPGVDGSAPGGGGGGASLAAGGDGGRGEAKVTWVWP